MAKPPLDRQSRTAAAGRATSRGGIQPPSAVSATRVAEDNSFSITAPLLAKRARFASGVTQHTRLHPEGAKGETPF